MTELLSVSEGVPASYPALPADVSSDAAAAIEAATVWRRIEGWITYRWQERAVTWVVEGPGVFQPPLRPYTIDTTEVWNGSAYETVTLAPAPVGFDLDCKTYRITATVGDTDTPPAIVQAAVTRLIEYLYQAGIDPALGHTASTDGDYSFQRPANWAPRALHYSGAADLLRSFR